MVRPCARVYAPEGGVRRSYAVLPEADYDMSVLDTVIAGSLRDLNVVEVLTGDRDHCVVRVFRSPPDDAGMCVYLHLIVCTLMMHCPGSLSCGVRAAGGGGRQSQSPTSIVVGCAVDTGGKRA